MLTEKVEDGVDGGVVKTSEDQTTAFTTEPRDTWVLKEKEMSDPDDYCRIDGYWLSFPFLLTLDEKWSTIDINLTIFS